MALDGGQQRGAALSEEDAAIWHAYAVRRRTQQEIGEELGISQQAVGAKLRRIKDEMPPPDLASVRAQVLSIYEDTMRQMAALAAMEGAPVTAGKDGDVVRDPESQAVVRDYSGRVAALKLANETTAHLRKMLGIDAAEKLELSGAVRYELVGIDPEDLK